MIDVGNDTKIFGGIQDLTIYSSNFAELKYSKIKYRVKKEKKINKYIYICCVLDFTTSKTWFNTNYEFWTTKNWYSNFEYYC